MSSQYQTALSWAFILAAAIGITYYYNPTLFARFLPQTAASSAAPLLEEKRPLKKVKQKAANSIRQAAVQDKHTQNNEEALVQKTRVVPAVQVNGNVTARTRGGQKVLLPRDEDQSMSNKDFAMQLARAQAGTQLESKPKPSIRPGKRKREYRDSSTVVPASAVESAADLTLSTETSSTNGRDGDDDMSPSSSPRSGPVSTAATSRAGDISDMLEAPPPKPMTLSIVDVDKTMKSPRLKPAKFEVVETKKQRQRRLKREQQKEEVLQSLATHELKKQQQLRTARMAEGTSAQIRANTFQPPKENAWKKVVERPVNHGSVSQPVQLLDTFELPTKNPVSPNEPNSSLITTNVNNLKPPPSSLNDALAQTGGTQSGRSGSSQRDEVANDASSTLNWAEDVTEDELRRLGIPSGPPAEDSWQNVVSKKNKKRGGKMDGDTSSEASSGFVRSGGRSTANRGSDITVKRAENLNRFQSFEDKSD